MNDSRLRPMQTSDLSLVLSWRNHPSVRRYMYTQHEISLEEHYGWFCCADQDPKIHLLIFEQSGTAMGFMNVSQLKSEHVADWGFYLAPAAPRGIGGVLGRTALQYAFTTLKLHKLCGQALEFNQGSIRLHRKLGFRQEGRLRDHHFDGSDYHNVIHFGLLKAEWEVFSEETDL